LTECPRSPTQSGGYFDASGSNAPTQCGGTPATGVVQGCMNASSAAYAPLATVDDGTCDMASSLEGDVLGCMYPQATNYDPAATRDDLSCIFGALVSGSSDNGGNDAGSGADFSVGNGGGSIGSACCSSCTNGLSDLAALIRQQHTMQQEQLELLRNQTNDIRRIDRANECARFVRGEGEANRTCFMLPADVPDPTDEFQILPEGVPTA